MFSDKTAGILPSPSKSIVMRGMFIPDSPTFFLLAWLRPVFPR
jgi:hypothetical protein